MAQIAQQDHIIIPANISVDEEGIFTIDENAQKEARRLYVRGTLRDAYIKTKNKGLEMEVRVCTTVVTPQKELQVEGVALGVGIAVDCGTITEDDYKD